MAEKEPRRRYPLKKHMRNIAVIIVATFLDCTGFLIFIQPNNFLAGGIWGVAGIIHYFIPLIPLGAYVAILNTPLLIWGWRKL
ncbi:MAG: YitT family protein, partial [Clostridia bacterium]|nr:YitT family protein [Clostridia bacterium]